MDVKKNFSIKKNSLRLLLKRGMIIFIFLSFFNFPQLFFLTKEVFALTITPSVTTVSIFPPTNLTATAIDHEQINLSWTAPSGTVGYYKVYRNSSSVGTTSAVSYSDTGLSPSTTYTYHVSAIDSYGIETNKSDSATATTQAAPAEEEEEDTGGPAFLPPPPDINEDSLIINNGKDYTNSSEVILNFSAEGAYQLAVSNNPNFTGSYWENYKEIKRWELIEGEGEKTVYAKFRNERGSVTEIISDSIVVDTTPPANISEFIAIPGDQQILLIWQNPLERDFAGVEIMGSTLFYPSSPLEGILTYKGGGNSFAAVGLENGTKYYYTAFSYDKAGNYSSGAIVSATPRRMVPPEEELPEEVPPEEVPPQIKELTINDFDFWKGEEKMVVGKEGRIVADSQDLLKISLDYDKVPEVLKTIMVTLKKDEESFSFLLRINSEKTKYEADFLAPKDPGEYELVISIFDYKNKVFKKITGFLGVIGIAEEEETPIEIVPEVPWHEKYFSWILFILLIIIAVIVIYFLYKRRNKSNNKSIRKEGVDKYLKKDNIN